MLPVLIAESKDPVSYTAELQGKLSANRAEAAQPVESMVRRRWQDVIHAKGFTLHTGPAQEVSTFVRQSRIPVTTNFLNVGHEWYVWRILLNNFLTPHGLPASALRRW